MERSLWAGGFPKHEFPLFGGMGLEAASCSSSPASSGILFLELLPFHALAAFSL